MSSLVFSVSSPANLTCPVAALKHSPSKRTKSIKSKPSSASGQASGASGSGQDSGAPPSKEGKTLIISPKVTPSNSVTLSLAIRRLGLGFKFSTLQTRSPGWQKVLLSPLSPRPQPRPPRPPSVSSPPSSVIGRGRGGQAGEPRPLCPLAPRGALRRAPPPLPVEVGREC